MSGRSGSRAAIGGLRLSAVLMVMSLAGCTSAAQSPSTEQRQTASPTLASTPTPSPTPSPIPSPTGTFVATGNMTHARAEATGTLLADGRVLIAGGYDAVYAPIFQFLASAEIYDPSTGKFTRAGTLENEYSGVAAVLLPNGKVLVVGDKLVEGNSLAGLGAELLDPSSGLSSSIALGPLLTHGTHNLGVESATVLADGRALVQVYDFDSLVNYLVAFDSTSGTFTEAGAFGAPDGWFTTTAVLLRDGSALIAGAISGTSPALSSAELFKP